MRNIRTVFHGGYTSSPSHQQFTSMPTLVICCLFYNSHSDRCEVVSHCGLMQITKGNDHFPVDQWYRGSFHVSVGHLYVFFGKMSIQSLCLFFNWAVWFLLLSSMSSLYILDINPSMNTWFVNIFFHSVGYLFLLVMVFTVQRLFSLM